ncbi:MAG: winged helix-turn-helix domain-containing protein, partial [Chloroflexota bacterium]|nr:winged helix-turn-helix domain-containing protein [Chloroflexota bacterium]
MKNAAPRLEITLLGGFTAMLGGAKVPDAAWRQRRAAAVVKLLALAPRHVQHREQIIDTLWPELEPGAAANNLRVALHHARKQLAAVAGDAAGAFLVRDGDGLRLGPPDLVRVDLDEFEAGVARVWRTADFAGAATALDLYRGDLLPEDLYEDWVADRRAVLRASYV